MNTKLTKIRKQNNYTQKQLAEKIFISQRAISAYENGERQPQIEILPKMANALNCSIEELVFAILETQKQTATKNKY